MRAPTPLSLVVVGHPALVSAVDLDVGGVQVDRHALGQRGRPLWCHHRQRGQRGGVHVAQPGLHRRPLCVGQPAGQPGRGRRAQPGHRAELLPSGVGTLAVKPDQEVLPGQLRGGHPHQQLPAGVAAAALLDRPDHRVEPADHVQPLDQLAHREHSRYRRQRRVRCADPHPLPPTPTTPYACHPIGVLQTPTMLSSTTASSQVSGHLSPSHPPRPTR